MYIATKNKICSFVARKNKGMNELVVTAVLLLLALILVGVFKSQIFEKAQQAMQKTGAEISSIMP
jgi:hypothetical protein